MQSPPRMIISALVFASAVAGGLRPASAETIEGTVLDLNGRAVAVGMVSLRAAGPGPDVVTVFTGTDGRFTLTGAIGDFATLAERLASRALGYEQVRVTRPEDGEGVVIIMRPTRNQADAAPATGTRVTSPATPIRDRPWSPTRV